MATLLGVTDAKGISNRNLKILEARSKNGKINKQTLMLGAKPYNAAAKRKLDQEEEWEINGYYSVEFDNCISLETGNENLFDDEIIAYAANGLVKSETSYITFTVCESSNCYYLSDDEKLTFITDVGTYFTALAEYLPNQVKDYCEGCEDNYDYCSGNLEAEAEDEDAAEDGDEEGDESGDEGEEEGDESGDEGDERKLKRNRRKLANNRYVEYIDCDQCDAYECFADMENDGERQLDEEAYDIDGAIEWLDALAECQAMEDAVYENTALYAGLICNSKGDGVEIGVFMDEDCSLYTTAKSFSDIMSYSDKQYYSMSQEIVQYTFTNQFDCQDIEIEYTNPYEENQDEDEEEEEDNGEAPEAAEYCADLFDNTVNMADCDIDENEDEQEDEDQDEDENMAYYEWYSYEISNEDAEDAQAVCKVLNGFDTDSGKNKSWQGKTVYDSGSSGSLYNYKKSKSARNGGGGGIALILIALLAVGGVAFFMFNKKKNDSKRAPLINASNGQMA